VAIEKAQRGKEWALSTILRMRIIVVTLMMSATRRMRTFGLRNEKAAFSVYERGSNARS
jgi:hypothetical protein